MKTKTKMELVKIGMLATLGTTVATATNMRGKNKKLHIIAGTTFVGLAFIHHSLYRKK